MNNLRKGLGFHIQKSFTEGVYTDNSQNRKLGRVGMSYGQKLNLNGFEEEPDSRDTFITNPKLILKRAKEFLSDRSFKLVKDLLERDNFREEDISLYNRKIYINTYTEVNPERDKDIINLGERKETAPKKENDYYKFIRETWSPTELDKKWLTTFEKEESWGKAKYYSMLSRLKIEGDTRQSIIDSEKSELWWKKYNAGEVDYNSSSSDISDEEVESYIKIHGRKITKDQLAESSKHFALYKALESYGVDFEDTDKDNIDKFKSTFKEYLINCPKNDFYQVVKNCSEDVSYMENLVRLRFAFKYNKMIAGEGWRDIKNDKNKTDISKRDEVLELCKQLEYAIDDVLGDNKDLFINNPNIDFIRFDKNVEWGGASYSKQDKTITITSEYFQSMKESRKNNEKAGTLSREKFMVEGFIHEIGHSLDVTADIYDSDVYKDFAKHLGYDKNRNYTIFTNAIKQDAKFFENQDHYLNIEKDKKQELIDKFKKPYQKYLGRDTNISDGNLADIFISGYSLKSACEGFAEYFSFYMGNKKVIDKAISDYNKNPKEFLSKANIKDWYKYSVYQGKWEETLNKIADTNEIKAAKEYYETVIEHNIEMLKDVKKIVQMAKKKMK